MTIVPIALSAALPARGDDEAFTSEVRAPRLSPADETTGFAQSVPVDEETSRMTSLSEVLSASPGVQVRTLGGPGAFASASIRGATPAQTSVYLDGVLLNAGGFPSVDLGSLRLASFGALDIYRGTTPVALGTGGPGGAISLRTRRIQRPFQEIALSGGSFGAARLLSLTGVRMGTVDALCIVSAERANGDFIFLNRNGTLSNPRDDRFEPRRNNAFQSGGALVKLAWRTGPWQWTAMNDLMVQHRGLPGLSGIPTRTASLRTLRDTAALQGDVPVGRRGELSAGLSWLGLREDLSDLFNEIGLGHQRVVAGTDALDASMAPRVHWSDVHDSLLRISARAETYTSRELVQGVTGGPVRRLIGRAALAHEWRPAAPFLLVPAIRLEAHGTKEDGDTHSSSNLFWSPSLGARFEPATGVFLRMNGARSVRPPDLCELYGDRGTTVGNPRLKAETAWTADAGVTLERQAGSVVTDLRFDSALFASTVNRLIAWVQNSQNTVRPENIDEARIAGVETSLQLTVARHLRISGNHTWLLTRNRSRRPWLDGRQLPGRPAHEGSGRIAFLATRDPLDLAAWFTGDFAAATWLDQANYRREEARILLGTGGRVSHSESGLSLTLEVRNLLNRTAVRDGDGRLQPLEDFVGFPLPGRTVFVTLDWATP